MTAAAKKTTLDMTQGPVWPVIITFAIPLLLGNAFQLLYNTVDSIILGNFVGSTALAAVGSTTQICNMLVKFFTGLSTGAGAVISRCFGKKDIRMLQRSVHTTVAISLFFCVVLTLFGVFACDWMLARMSTPADVIDEASLYLKIYFGGISGLLLYNMGSAILRAVGDSRRPLIALVLSSLLNIVLDLLFVLVFHQGVAGVGIATILSQALSAVYVIYAICATREEYRFQPSKLCVDTAITRDIFKIGMPIALQMAIIAFSNVFVQAYINVFGSDCMAGWSTYTKLDQYLLLPVQTIGQACTTFTAQNLGANKLQRTEKGVHDCLKLSLAVAVVCAILLTAGAPLLARIFSPKAEVIRYGVLFMRMCSPLAVLTCFNQVYSGALRGLGNAAAPMAITLTSHVLLRQIYLFIITSLLPGNVYVVGFGYPFGWIINAAACAVYYYHCGWQKLFTKQDCSE